MALLLQPATPPNSTATSPRRRLAVSAADPRRRLAVSAADPRRRCSSLSDSLRHHSVLLLHLAAASAASFSVPHARASPFLPPAATVAVTSAPESSVISAEQAAGDEETRAAFEIWKSKTFSLTVPLKIVALRGSVPPSWIKDFLQVQGRRVKLDCEYRGSLESIFSELKAACTKGRLEPNSAMTADLVTIGGSWFSYAIRAGLLEPIRRVDEQSLDWFNGLHDKWKAYLRRNDNGELDPAGCIYGAPYRWGTMVIAYKKSQFRKRNLAPIEDWGDLLRPELAGRISIIDSPREVVGVVLKHMGASYNTKDIDSQVPGGRDAVLHNLRLLQSQVRLFDGIHYLKAFGAGEVWVAVGWSSDVIPAAKRLSDVAVIVPKSGSSLWLDLWAVPSATRFTTDKIGGRVRSPSPLIHQWIEFCLQSARQLPFQQEVIPGASPVAFGDRRIEEPIQLGEGRPKLDTNLIDGSPPPEILDKCEFLEPLSEKASEDYSWLISRMQKPGSGWLGSMLNHFSSLVYTYRPK